MWVHRWYTNHKKAKIYFCQKKVVLKSKARDFIYSFPKSVVFWLTTTFFIYYLSSMSLKSYICMALRHVGA